MRSCGTARWANADDLEACDVIYVAPDIPTDDSGQSDLAPINALLQNVFEASRSDAVIVVLSQVPPGFTRSRQSSGQTLYYQVETLIFGRAVERALQPERYIVGCAKPAQPLAPAYLTFLNAHGCPVLPMRYESAELAKISINMCLVAHVSVANTLAGLCEKVGADWAEIVPALKLDKRIGQYAYLAAGLGLSGGNLERDLTTLMMMSREHGADAEVVRSFISNSAHRKVWPLRTIHDVILSKMDTPTIGILGLAYKENTRSTKNSPAIALVRDLGPWPLRVYDPQVPASAVPHAKFVFAGSALDAAAGVDVLAVMTPWPEFRLDCSALAATMRGRLVVDPYRMLDGTQARVAGLDVRTIGVGT